ncbi:MAG: hypothetical protein KF745_01020 [Phycisphaeraceae bacterium]|nr:hypothetical protein [Phycisphaeraceae bacterium]
MARPTHTTSRPSGAMPSAVTLSDLTADLLWPKLLRAPLLGLGAGKLVVAFLAIVAVAALSQAGTWIDGRIMTLSADNRSAIIASAFGPTGWSAVRSGDLPSAVWRWGVRGPLEAARQFPITVLVFGPLMLWVWLVGMGAISRMAACEFAQGIRISWPEAAGFAIGRWKSLVGSIVAPWLLIWAIALGTAVFGLLLLRWPVINLLGSVLFGLSLLLSLVAVAVAVGYWVGHHLLVPAVTCDGADALDAIQRAYAYVLGRPLRLVTYLLITGAVVWVAGVVAWIVVSNTVGFAAQGAQAWAGDHARSMIIESTAGRGAMSDSTTGTYAATGSVLKLWTSAAVVVVLAYVITTAMSGVTILYLLMRRVSDGQDETEIWMPGIVPGTMARAEPGPEPAVVAPDEVEINGDPPPTA